jgi:hypothetical protein
VWRVTGKPAAAYIHAEHCPNLTYNDLCGPPNSPAASATSAAWCSTWATTTTARNAGDSRFTRFREVSQSMISPTINLLDGPGGAIRTRWACAEHRHATDDIVLWYDMYAGMFNLSFSGNAGSTDTRATRAAGERARRSGPAGILGLVIFNPEPQCFTDFEPFAATSSRSSPRIRRHPGLAPRVPEPPAAVLRFAISLGCNSNEGGYFDNVSLAFVDLPACPGQASASSTVDLGSVSSDIWQLSTTRSRRTRRPVCPARRRSTPRRPDPHGLEHAQATGNRCASTSR